MIDRLSADECKLINYLKLNGDVHFIILKMYRTSQQGYSVLLKRFTGIEQQINFDFPDNLNIYFENLMGNGIIRIERGLSKPDEDLYEQLMRNYSGITDEAKAGKYSPNVESVEWEKDFTK